MPGTTAYMSPEQLHGEPLDARSDVFSLGCVLQEMATRRHPFRRQSVAGTIAAILNEPPPPLTSSGEWSAELQRIISKCLDKDKGRRYQTASDLLVDLHNVNRVWHPRRVALQVFIRHARARSARPRLSSLSRSRQ
ncbi:MAG: protein kinase domain-containing protein [Vicinamibacterales bacterium]